jgi:hypothetical protein
VPPLAHAQAEAVSLAVSRGNSGVPVFLGGCPHNLMELVGYRIIGPRQIFLNL